MKNRTKSVIIKAAVLLAALVLQLGPVQRLSVAGFTPNLCVAALVGVCLFGAPAEALVFGGVFGLLIDGAASRGFGVCALLCLYLAAGVKCFVSEKINNSPALMAGAVWLFTLLYYLAYGLLSLAVPRGGIGVGRWLLTALVTASLNGVISLPVFWAVCRASRGGAEA